MSLPEQTTQEFGDLVCHFLKFKKIGDHLPAHAHTEDDIHVTWVRKGPFKVYGDGWEQTHQTGAFLDWEVGQMHGFIAMDNDVEIVNTQKNVKRNGGL